MTTHQKGAGEPWALADVTRQDRARFVKQARRLRNEQIDRLLHAAGRRLARLWPAPAAGREARLTSSPAH